MVNIIRFFEEIKDSKNILIAGAGGGFDIYSGIPIFINLITQGKNVILGNFSFTHLRETTSKEVFPNCFDIAEDDQDLSGQNYFPEKHLKAYLQQEEYDPLIYAFSRTGVQPLKDSYNYLIAKHQIDTLVLIDGGTDSLMFGDEEGLGTPQEDSCSLAAAYQSDVSKKVLLAVGFGIDHFHGVSHYRFLENVTRMSVKGGYWGLFQLTPEMKEAQLFINAVEHANQRMIGMESIVANSIKHALLGNYGDFHFSPRTKGSELWINLFMTIYWCFDLNIVVAHLKYYDEIKDSQTMGELNTKLYNFRNSFGELRKNKQIPI